MQPSAIVATGMEASRTAIAAEANPACWGGAPAATDSAKLLTSHEEASLIRRAQQGDDRARERLVNVNMRLVYSIARRYRCRSLTLEDLIQEGVIGMLVAIDRFDFTQGCR